MPRKGIERIVEELALQVPFKDDPQIGDALLVVEDDGRDCRVLFAQVLGLSPRRIGGDEWLQLDLVFLTLPLSYGSLLAPDGGLKGLEIFETAGRRFFVKAVNTRAFLDFYPPPPENSDVGRTVQPPLSDQPWPEPPWSGPPGGGPARVTLRLVK